MGPRETQATRGPRIWRRREESVPWQGEGTSNLPKCWMHVCWFDFETSSW